MWGSRLSEKRHSEGLLGPGAMPLRGKGLGFLVEGVRVKGQSWFPSTEWNREWGRHVSHITLVEQSTRSLGPV